jgi:hypothetical protein
MSPYGSQLHSLLILDSAFEVGSNHAILVSLQVLIEEFKLAPPFEKEADDATGRYVEELDIVLEQCESVHTFEISAALFSTHHKSHFYQSKDNCYYFFASMEYVPLCNFCIRFQMKFSEKNMVELLYEGKNFILRKS